jgi:hypothetical protein
MLKKSVILRGHNSQYSLFDESRKWKLKNGMYVEDVFHEFGLKSNNEHAAHSFIIILMHSS